MRNRYFICFLLACILLYYGMPYLSFQTNNLEGYFSLAWFGFALIVVAGNLVGILYTPKRNQKGQVSKRNTKQPERLKQYQ